MGDVYIQHLHISMPVEIGNLSVPLGLLGEPDRHEAPESPAGGPPVELLYRFPDELSEGLRIVSQLPLPEPGLGIVERSVQFVVAAPKIRSYVRRLLDLAASSLGVKRSDVADPVAAMLDDFDNFVDCVDCLTANPDGRSEEAISQELEQLWKDKRRRMKRHSAAIINALLSPALQQQGFDIRLWAVEEDDPEHKREGSDQAGSAD